MCPPPCTGDPEDCYNVLQVFEDTAPSSRPDPSCTDVASWFAGDTFDPWGLPYSPYSFESANLPWSNVSPSDVRGALFSGGLISFNMVSPEGQTLCSFVSTWNAPLKSQWIVESPPLTPDSNAPSTAVCDSGWAGAMSQCQADEDSLLQAAQSSVPPQDTGDLALDPDYVITVDPP
jgi:hypothetical protein